MEKLPFYQDGLKFECTRCSACCRHDPGFVFMTQADLTRLAAHHGQSESEFKKEWCRVIDFGFVKRLSLKEKSNYDCIFWGENGCDVYGARPLQCRSFPFWPRNLSSQEDWDSSAQDCPGMNKGKLHDLKTIKDWLAGYDESELLEG